MRSDEVATVVAQCMEQEGARDLLRAIERRLERPLPALLRLHALLDAWVDPVAIDDAVRDAIDAVDPVVEMNGTTVRAQLVTMRIATTERAAALRRTRATARRRAIDDG